MKASRKVGIPANKEGAEGDISLRRDTGGKTSIFGKINGIWQRAGLNVLGTPSNGSFALFRDSNKIHHDSRFAVKDGVPTFRSNLTVSGDIIAKGPVSELVCIATDALADAGIQLENTADGASWSLGSDGSDSHKFKISKSYTVGGNPKLTIDNDGNVGIGDSSPNQKLVVEDSSEGEAKVLAVRNNLENNTTDDSVSIQFSPDKRQDNAARIIVGKDSNFSGSADRDTNMRFVVIRNNSSKEVMRLTSDEYVGIGTTTPSRKLDVYSTSAIVSSQFTSTNSEGHLMDLISNNSTDGYNGFRFYEEDNFRMALTHIQTGTRGYLQVGNNWTSGSEILVIDGDNSRVGIGTTTPSVELDVNGTIAFASLKDTGESITVTKFVDEADGIGSNDNDTTIPTSAAVKDYVDTNVTAQDLDATTDSGTIDVDLDSETLTVAGGGGISTSASSTTITIAVDAAQTGITSILNTSLVIGRDSGNQIDFGTTDNIITFKADDETELELAFNTLQPAVDGGLALGNSSYTWAYLYIKSTGDINFGAGNVQLIHDTGELNLTGDFNLTSAHEFKINDTSVLSNNTLGSGVTGSSLTSVGTIATGVWQGTAIAHAYIGNDAIEGDNLADNAVDSEHYTDGSIDHVHLAADIVDGDIIVDNAIDSEHYTDGSIDTAHIADSQITFAKLADAAVQTSGEISDPGFGDNDTSLLTAAAIQDKILSYGYLTTVSSLDINGLDAETIATGDELVFSDIGDNGIHKVTIDNIAAKFAGDGLAASAAVISLDINELNTASIASGDYIAYSDEGAAGDPTRKESIDDVATLFAGSGLTATNAVIAVDTLNQDTTGTAANATHVLVTDNEDTDEENLITFVEGATSATGNVGLEMDGHLTYNPSSGIITTAGITTTAATQSTSTTTGDIICPGGAGINKDVFIGGSLDIGGDLKVKGNDILNSDGTTTITMDTSENVAITGDLTVTGGDISGGADTSLTLSADLNVDVKLDADGDGDQYFRVMSGSDVLSYIDESGNLQIDGDLQVNGNDIAFDAAASTIAIDASAHNVVGQALTITAGSTTAGTTNDIAGGLLHLRGGQGKGSGAGGVMRFSVADGGSSGSVLNSYAVAMNIADDKKVTMSGDVVLDGGDLYVQAASGANAAMVLIADDEEDDADVWTFQATDATSSNVLTFSNKISGSSVAHLTLTPHSTVASSNATFAGNLAVSGTDGITAGAVVWQSFPFIISSASHDEYYHLDVDDTANSYRRWDSEDDDPTGVDYRTVAGNFVVPENCTLVAMHGVISNSTSTNNPKVEIFHGTVTEGTGNTTLASAGSVTVSIGTSRVPYVFSKEDFDTDIDAGDIVIPTVIHSDDSATRSFVGSLTLKFITR